MPFLSETKFLIYNTVKLWFWFSLHSFQAKCKFNQSLRIECLRTRWKQLYGIYDTDRLVSEQIISTTTTTYPFNLNKTIFLLEFLYTSFHGKLSH